MRRISNPESGPRLDVPHRGRYLSLTVHRYRAHTVTTGKAHLLANQRVTDDGVSLINPSPHLVPIVP